METGGGASDASANMVSRPTTGRLKKVCRFRQCCRNTATYGTTGRLEKVCWFRQCIRTILTEKLQFRSIELRSSDSSSFAISVTQIWILMAFALSP